MAGEPSNVSAGSSSRARGLYDIGLIYEKQGLIKEAYEEFKEALRLDPSDIEILLKYEELYKHPTVQELLAEEQSRAAPVVRTVSDQENWPGGMAGPTPASSSSLPGQRKSQGVSAAHQGGLCRDIPPTFTFTNESKLTAIQSEGTPTERSSRVAQFAEGMFQTGLTSQGPAPTHWGCGEDSAGLMTFQPNRPTLLGSVAEVDAQDARLGFGYADAPKTLAATLFSWVVIWLTATYYYQIVRRDQCKEERSYPAIVIWTLSILVIAATIFRCATTCRVEHVNLSGGIKFTCFSIIVVAVLWHKLWQEPAYLARQSSDKNHTCSLFTDSPQDD